MSGADQALVAMQAIEACTALTGRMLSAAGAGEWSAVTELDAARRPCFQDLDFDGLEEAQLLPLLEGLRALVAMDGRLSALAAQARSSALDDVRSVRGRARGSASYQALAARA